MTLITNTNEFESQDAIRFLEWSKIPLDQLASYHATLVNDLKISHNQGISPVSLKSSYGYHLIRGLKSLAIVEYELSESEDITLKPIRTFTPNMIPEVDHKKFIIPHLYIYQRTGTSNEHLTAAKDLELTIDVISSSI